MDKRVDLNHVQIKYAFSLGVDFDYKLVGTVLKEFKCSHPSSGCKWMSCMTGVLLDTTPTTTD